MGSHCDARNVSVQSTLKRKIVRYRCIFHFIRALRSFENEFLFSREEIFFFLFVSRDIFNEFVRSLGSFNEHKCWCYKSKKEIKVSRWEKIKHLWMLFNIQQKNKKKTNITILLMYLSSEIYWRNFLSLLQFRFEINTKKHVIYTRYIWRSSIKW